jgi:hypothetical protein
MFDLNDALLSSALYLAQGIIVLNTAQYNNINYSIFNHQSVGGPMDQIHF